MALTRITVALTDEEKAMVDTLTSETAFNDMTTIVRIGIRHAYLQHLARESDLMLSAQHHTQTHAKAITFDGVGQMNKDAIERKVKRAR
jgi:Arc/MetJ-type ribon-helix-helix transcriptional regulator